MAEDENRDSSSDTTRRSILGGVATVGVLGSGVGLGAASESPSSASSGEDPPAHTVKQHSWDPLTIQSTGNSREALIIKDCNPWNVAANERVLEGMGVSYTVINSSSLSNHDLEAYDTVLLPSTQSSGYYNTLEAESESLTNYVEQGGTLVAHVAVEGRPCTAQGATSFLPGGVGQQPHYTDSLTKADPSHPVVDSISDSALDGWNYSAHGHLTDLDSDARIVIGIPGDVGDQPTYAEYKYGDGRVLATTQTMEWPWANNGSGTKRLLGNEISYALTGQGDSGDQFAELKESKRNLAARIDENSLGYVNDTGMVEPALSGLTEAVDDEDLSREEAVNAVERMERGERVTDTVFAGAGPGESEYVDGSMNIAKLTGQNATNPIVEILFAGLTVVRFARHIPFVGGAADRAARFMADIAADIAGMFSRTLERVIRQRATEAGFAILEGVEAASKEKGQPLVEEEYREVRDTEAQAFVEDSTDIIFRDMMFSEERDLYGIPTTSMDDSVTRLVDELDNEPSGPEFVGDQSEAIEAADQAIDDINGYYDAAEDKLTDSIVATVLDYIGILEAILVVVAFGATVTGVGSAIGSFAGVIAGLLALGVDVPLRLIQWGVGAKNMLKARYRHQLAIQDVLEPGSGVGG